MTSPIKKKLTFIEDKSIDRDRLDQLFTISTETNHWANFGPVSTLLERHIIKQLKLPTHGKVLLTSSCSTALEAMAQTLNLILKRKARFLTSSFAFFSTNRGTYAEAQVVDCDEQGFISLEALAKIPVDSYDAIVVTNIFGLLNDIRPYWEFARARDKYLLVDNAAGYTAFPEREVREKLIEAISFHHTKPHGFGEGGCIIAHEAIAPSLKAIINFGAGLPHNPAKLGLNAKLSDPAAAFILQRLEQRNHWAPSYIFQAKRIKSIAEQAGLVPLVSLSDPNLSVPGQLPFLSRHPIKKAALENDVVTLRKYYIPFHPDMPSSQDMYARIVNIPCHPDMEKIEDDLLFDLFSSFVK